MKTFMDRAIAGEISNLEEEMLDAVEAWHQYEPTIPEDVVGESLQTWLGMFWFEYARWVQHPKELIDIINDRKKSI